MKKVLGDIDVQADHYNGRVPEFALMSRMPGIGKPWVDKYWSDIVKGHVQVNGYTHSIPRYYEQLLKKKDLRAYVKLKMERKENREKKEFSSEYHFIEYNDSWRQKQKNDFKEILINKSLKRSFENAETEYR